MLLSQLGLPYERVPTDIFAGESQTDEYLARNPAGRTPLLEVDGGSIPESGAILLYLAEGTPFLPDRPDRARRTCTRGCSSSRTCSSRTSARRASGG